MKKSSSASTLSIEALEQAIDSFVENSFLGYKHNKIKNAKVIHDSVHGTNIFHPHEIAFLDLPITQRLRRISQTDVASLVFPAGNHNRFEHTVGVAVVAGQMVESIFLKCKDIVKEEQKDFIYRHCRIAAILHDSGHGPFSHLTEQIYSSQFKKIRDDNPIFSGARPHEIISYFIATSAIMRKFNKDVIENIYGVSVDLGNR